MPLWILITLFVVSTAASIIIQQSLAAKTNATSQDFQAPTATAGNPIPVWWGVANVAPNTVWYGNLNKVKHLQWFYLMSAHHILGWGVVNEIIDISFQDKSGRHWGYLHQLDEFFFSGDGGEALTNGMMVNGGVPLEFRVYGNHGGQSSSSQSLFGGDGQGGGVGGDDTNDQITKGHMAMYWGFDDETAQPVDPYLSGPDAYNAAMRWPNIAYLRMGSSDGIPFYIAAGSGTPAPMKLICRRTAWWDKDNTNADSPLGESATEATIRYDANPAEILFDILTHKGYGIGRDPANIDVDSFAAAADTLREEVITTEKTGFGISVVLTQATDAAGVIQGILQTIDATLATNPVTGKLRLKLIRPDYVVDDLPVFDASNASEVSYAPSVWAETINEVKLTYNHFVAITDAVDDTNMTFGFVDDVASDQDQANFEATGRIRTLQIDMPYITDPDIAQLVCARLCRAQSSPLARYSFKSNRMAFALMQGDAFVASYDAFGVANLILRITTIDYGTLEDGAITIEAVQDVFSVTAGSYITPPPAFVPPTSTSSDHSGTGYSVSVPPDAPAPLWGGGF